MNVTCVYIRTNASLEATAELVGDAAGLTLRRDSDDLGPFFSGVSDDGDFGITLALNEADDEDPGSYELELEVDGYENDARIAFARGVFDKLVASKSVAVALWDEQRGMLDRFEPTATAAE